MKAVVLFSGGKDSCLALHKAIQQGYDIKYLLFLVPKGQDAWLFHTPHMELLKKQIEMLGLKYRMQATEVGEKVEFENLRAILGKIKGKADKLVIGGIASSYQGSRIKKVAEEVGLDVYCPLWSYTGEKLWNELLDEGFKVILTKIATQGLSPEFLGKVIDKERLENLKKLSEKHKFDLTGEGGDFETAVLYMPGFKKEIKMSFDTYSEDKYRHFLKIKKVE
jgi:ABC transporter with metal-binding/Fe-S-binding domain ATP-binding protein